MARKFCKHYRAMAHHKTCELGLSYDQFKGTKSAECPCFFEQLTQPARCPSATYLTPEEVEAEDRWLMERIANVGKARAAIVEHLGGPWKRGVAGASGQITCPVCSTGKLRFSRAGCNGHIYAACTTAECVRWME